MKNVCIKWTMIVCFVAVLPFVSQTWAGSADMDSSFYRNAHGGVNSGPSKIAIQSDGKIFVIGSFSAYNGISANKFLKLNKDMSIDTSFNIGSGFDGSYLGSIALQSNGKILIAGNFIKYQGVPTTGLVRINDNGSIDSGFIMAGFINNGVSSIAVQNDNKILIAGTFTVSGSSKNLIRLNPNGSLDSSFDIGSGFNGSVYEIALQSDGKIIVGGGFTIYQGTTTNRIIRLNSDGSRDNSFTMGAGFDRSVREIVVDGNGKILIGGYFLTYQGVSASHIIRLNNDGSKDASFNIGSAFYEDSDVCARGITIDKNGKIVVTGMFKYYQGSAAYNLIRLNNDGSRDSSFNIGAAFGDGLVYNYDVKIGTDDKIIVVGGFTSYQGIFSPQGLISINPDGSRNETLNNITNGFDYFVGAVTSQTDGKILVGGFFKIQGKVLSPGLTRLNSDGSRDSSFNIGNGFNVGQYGYDYRWVSKIVVDGSGKILVIGNFTTYQGVSANKIIRLNSDGSKDTSFNIGAGFNSDYYSSPSKIILQSNGKMLVFGNFTTYQGAAVKGIIRLNSDGSRDTSLVNIGSGYNGTIYDIAIDPIDGKTLVAGNFTTYQGAAVNHLIKVNDDGSRDLSLDPGVGFNYYPQVITTQADGKIIAGGNMFSYQGANVNGLVRINRDGSRDTGFVAASIFDRNCGQQVEGMYIQNNGKIFAWGSSKLVRFNTNGSIDTGFIGNEGAGCVSAKNFDSTIAGVTILLSGNIVVGGRFSTYKSTPAEFLINLYGDSATVNMPNTTDTGTMTQAFLDQGYTQSAGTLFGSTPISLAQTQGFIPVNLTITNNNIQLNISQSTQFKTQDNITNYTGLINLPTNRSFSSIYDEIVIKSFKVGSADSLKINNGLAELSTTLTGSGIGNNVNIYYSQDNGASWYVQGTTGVTTDNGEKTVSFTTNHFTDFAITIPVAISGSFMINNNDSTTNSGTVTLNITTTPTASKMRFSNDGLNRSSWMTFATTYNWTLSSSYGNKTVYAEFDANGNGIADVQTTDSINYIDAVAPIITLIGGSSGYVELGTNYIEQGATWTDTPTTNSGFIANPTSGTVDTNTIGTYLLDYSYTDIAGNEGIATRTITVRDTLAPNATLISLTPELVGTGAQITLVQHIKDASGTSGIQASISGFGLTSDVTLTLVSGNITDGIWSGVYTFPEETLDGTYTILGVQSDILGNSGHQTIGQVILDKTAPSASIISITPNIVGTSNTTTIMISAQDTTAGIKDLSVKDITTDVNAVLTEGTSLPTAANEVGNRTFTQEVTDIQGEHTIELTIQDMTDNSFSTTGNFIYDTVAPVITIDPYTTGRTNQALTVTASTNEGTLNTTEYTFTTNGTFNFEATDDAENIGTSTVEINNIDQTAPSQVIPISPIDRISVTTNSTTLTWDPAIDNGSNINGYIRELTLSGGTVSTGFTTETEIQIDGLTNGTYSRSVYAIDNVGNTGVTSSIFNFVVDISIPSNNGGGNSHGGSSSNNDSVRSNKIIENPVKPVETLFHNAADRQGNISNSKYSKEMNNAYLRAYKLGITDAPSIQNANMEGTLIRSHMAKMVTEYAINVLKKEIDTGAKCEFKDMKTQSEEMQYYTKTACQLGLMGLKTDGNANHFFNPELTITRAQFGTVLSRLLYNENNNRTKGDTGDWYSKHLVALKKAGIMSKINKPTNKEARGWVMLMMMRAAK